MWAVHFHFISKKYHTNAWTWFTEDARELQQGYEWTDNGLQTKPGQEVQIEELDFEFMEDVEVDTDQPRKVEVQIDTEPGVSRPTPGGRDRPTASSFGHGTSTDQL